MMDFVISTAFRGWSVTPGHPSTRAAGEPQSDGQAARKGNGIFRSVSIPTSTLVTPRRAVRAVAKYTLAIGKSRRFIAEHSHAFEGFEVKGKNFLVIVGAGGLHRPLNTDERKMGGDVVSYVLRTETGLLGL